jgi:hypothetical protein
MTFPNLPNHSAVDKRTESCDERLARGMALGGVVFSTNIHGKSHRLSCTMDCVGGRGLRVFDAVAKGVTIARGSGKIVRREQAVVDSGSFKIYDTKDTYLLLDPPTTSMPAQLANTSDGVVANNCRISHKASSNYFSIVTLRALEPGEEVLVAYGSKYTTIVREVAKELVDEGVRQKKISKEVHGNARFKCMRCNMIVIKRRYKYHSKLVCDQRINFNKKSKIAGKK